MGPSGRITHVIGYIGYIVLFGTSICRFCIWVELPVQMRLCPIFMRIVGSPDIHELRCIYTSIQEQDTNSIEYIKEILNILRILNINIL